MRHILITGASSGIGRQLALDYANPNTTLSLCGRDKNRLDEITHQCTEKGAHVTSKIIDVSNRSAMQEWVLAIDNALPLDMIIANAGVGLTATGYEAAEQTFAINIDGVVNTIHPALTKMEERSHGQVVLISSVAGYIGLPSAPAYSASKNFVRSYGEALRGKLASKGIQVNVACPGFVKSRLTDQNKFRMPFLMNTNKAAKIIINGIDKNKGRIVFPWPMLIGIKILSILPYPLYEMIVKKLPNKS